MALKNTSTHYGSVAKFFHWLVFILVACSITIGFIFDLFSKPIKVPLIITHKFIGLTILLLMLLRLGWMLQNPKPKLIAVPKWEQIAANTVHGLLYIALFVMPLSGWIMSTAGGRPPELFNYTLAFPGIPQNKALMFFFGNIHQYTAWILISLITIHALAAIKHHFYDKDPTLKRMLPTGH